MHKVHALGFPLDHVADGIGVAPLPPPGKGFVEAMGRTNDAILFGGTVQLFVTGPDDAASDLARRLPSTESRDYGRPFAEVFAAVNTDVYAMDPWLFAPARGVGTALDSGRSFHGGHLASDMLDRSFAGTGG